MHELRLTDGGYSDRMKTAHILSHSLQLLANVMLYLCAAMVGVMSYYMADRKYRTAFLEARQSLEVKLTLEEQSTQQVSGDTHTHTHTHTHADTDI